MVGLSEGRKGEGGGGCIGRAVVALALYLSSYFYNGWFSRASTYFVRPVWFHVHVHVALCAYIVLCSLLIWIE